MVTKQQIKKQIDILEKEYFIDYLNPHLEAKRNSIESEIEQLKDIHSNMKNDQLADVEFIN